MPSLIIPVLQIMSEGNIMEGKDDWSNSLKILTILIKLVYLIYIDINQMSKIVTESYNVEYFYMYREVSWMEWDLFKQNFFL